MNRLRDFLQKFGPVMLIMLISQAVSACGLILLSRLGLTVSDLYSMAIQAGNGALTGITIGVVYLLAIGRPQFNRWKLFGNIAATFSIVLAVITIVMFLKISPKLYIPKWQIIVIGMSFGIGGAALALAGNFAVRDACVGKPKTLAAITIIPNAGMLLATCTILFSSKLPASTITAPAVVWGTLNIIQFLCIKSHTESLRSGSQIYDPKAEPRDGMLTHSVALLLGVITSTFIPTFYITATAKLDPGSTTALFFCSRIGTAIVSLGVNSVLMVHYNWFKRSKSNGMTSATLLISTMIIGSAGFMANYIFALPITGYGLVLTSWLTSLVAAPLVMREVNARRLSTFVMAKSAIDLTISIGTAISLTNKPSVSGYFAAFMLSQCVTTSVCGWALKNRLLISSAIGSFAMSLVLLFFGW